MRSSPSYLVHKSVSSMDPMRASRPHGGLYSAAAGIRDMPFNRAGTSLALAAVGMAVPGLVPSMLGIYSAASAYAFGREAISAVPSAVRALERAGRRRPEFTAPMVDTRAAMSMRQASLRAMHDSGYFLRNVIGREARLLHS